MAGGEDPRDQKDTESEASSRRAFVKTLGISGIVGGAAYLIGDRWGPTMLLSPGLGPRGSAGPSYVVFQTGGTVYGQNGINGTIEFQGTATSVLESIASSMAPQGGQVLVVRGSYVLTQTFPEEDSEGPILLTGEGRGTILGNGGQPFDAVDLEKIGARDLSFEDMNSVLCYTGLSANAMNRAARSLPCDFRGGERLPNTEVRFLGDYIRVRTTAPGSYPAISTGTAVLNRMDPDRLLRVRATVRLSPPSASAVPLFAEPYKGDFSNFLGFLWDPPNLFTITRLDGADTTNAHLTSEALMEGDHVYEIEYRLNSVRFLFDGGVLDEHTTNISQPPHEWSAAEPNGSAMSCYLKRPFLEVVTP